MLEPPMYSGEGYDGEYYVGLVEEVWREVAE